MQNFLAARIQECLDHVRRINLARRKGEDWTSVPFPRKTAVEQVAVVESVAKELAASLEEESSAGAAPGGDEGEGDIVSPLSSEGASLEFPGDQGVDPRELLSLEWTRQLLPKEAHDFLSSLHGLGRKSVACIVLLTLRNKEFPVDVNVGRIAARWGGVGGERRDGLDFLVCWMRIGCVRTGRRRANRIGLPRPCASQARVDPAGL